MAENANTDYYEALQVSPNADAETIQRVYRLLARRFHPDNVDTGNDSRFRLVHEAYTILSDPESRAKYDVFHQQQRQNRWKIATSGVHADGAQRAGASPCYLPSSRLIVSLPLGRTCILNS